MKRLILTVATVVLLASVASAPADARHFMRMKPNVATVALAATAAVIAADSYFYGPSYGDYVAPAPLVYGAPIYIPGRPRFGHGYRF